MSFKQSAFMGQSQQSKQYAIERGELLRRPVLQQATYLHERINQQQTVNILLVDNPGDVKEVSLDSILASESAMEFGEYFSRANDSLGYKMQSDGVGARPDIPDDRNKFFADKQSIQEQIIEQLTGLPINDQWKAVAIYLVNSLDDHGFIREPELEHKLISKQLGMPEQEIAKVHNYLKNNLEPAGIMTQNGIDCLVAKITRDDSFDVSRDIAIEILTTNPEALSNLNVEALKKSQLFQKIKASDPGSLAEDLVTYINGFSPTVDGFGKDVSFRTSREADFIVSKKDGLYEAKINAETSPRVSINTEYLAELRQCIQHSKKPNEVHKFSQIEKENLNLMGHLNELLRNTRVESEQVITYILNSQSKFLESGNEFDKNVLLNKDVAEKFDIGESTVSSIITGTIINYEGKSFALKEFMERGVAMKNENRINVSPKDVQETIRMMVLGESEKQPLTDIDIHKALKAEGYEISVGRVQRLREGVSIPPAKAREELYKTHSKQDLFGTTQDPSHSVAADVRMV